MNFNYLRYVSMAFLLIFMGSSFTYAQTVYTFTAATATGENGPTQAMVNTEYAGTNLAGKVDVTGGIQYWEIPATGKYVIEAFGGQGYGPFGGRGAHMTGEFILTGGDTLKILVGQKGGDYLNFPATTYNQQFGGGGGSFVTKTDNTPYVVAGGGGGNHTTNYVTTCDGQITTSGAAGVATLSGAGGTAGMGGMQATSADGGGGLLGDGDGTTGGQAFINGGLGGFQRGRGGFGGGGGTSSWNNFRGGGGGGYSGGGGANANSGTTCCATGGGGGSFNAGSNPVNLAGIQLGDGQVIITQLPTVPDDAGVSAIIEPDNNCEGTYDIKAEVTNFGTNQIDSVDVNWTLNGVPMPPHSIKTLLDTSNGMFPSKDTITLGSVTLTAGNTEIIKAWTLLPNNAMDTSNGNDTTIKPVLGYAFPVADLGNDTTICPAEFTVLEGGSGYDSLRWSTNQTSPSIVVIATGMYYVTKYQNGCATSDTMFLSHHPPAPTVDIGPEDTTICSNDSLILDATTAGVTYEWQNSTTNPTQTVKTAGQYWVIIEDANTCNNSDTINVSLHADPTVSHIVGPSNNVCFGVPVTFTANGQSDGSIMYQWKINGTNSGSLTASNTFMPTVENGDVVSVDLVTDLCVTGTQAIPSNDITMTVNPEPRAITGPDTVIENTTATYAIGFSANPLMWTIAGGAAIGTTTSNILSVEWGGPNTSAMVTCSETEGSCTRPNEKSVVVVSIVGVKENKDRIVMGYAYPNPAESMITIPLSSRGQWDVSVNLFDLTGKHVKSIYEGGINGNKNITFSVDDLENGLYFYKVTTSDGFESVKKITVQH